MSTEKRIAVIMTVHNRKAKTLECLKKLFHQALPNNCSFKVFMTDDGCTDGTREAVAQQFPQVVIVDGDGTLFWNRGMHRAWSEAAKSSPDFYLWLNDDTYLYSDALCQMLDGANRFPNSILVGSTNSPNNSEVMTYGGYVDNKNIYPLNDYQECQSFNGNVILVPRVVFEKIGNLDSSFSHSIGDIDYGLRARKVGFTNIVVPGFVGSCAVNPMPPKWMRSSVSLKERLENLYSPLGYSIPSEFFRFNVRHYGYLHAIRVFITNHIRLLFPGLFGKAQ